MTGDLRSFMGNSLAELVISRFQCRQRILVVADGPLGYGADGLGLSEFIGILQAAGHVVTTAHRNAAPPYHQPFEQLTIDDYDQLWLFAYSTSAISDAEQATIAQFMQQGGGVFATGDHSSIGVGMGARIPRVRKMRNWSNTTLNDANRLDTVTNPGPDRIKQTEDQADDSPQRILPVYFATGGAVTDPASWVVHPVLRDPSGAVDVLPDHAHESECLAFDPRHVDCDVAADPPIYAHVEEWPRGIGAEIIAAGLSSGGFLTGLLYPPVRPRTFGAISVYDGDRAGVGRIVCDASWHHFVNVNLNGAGAPADTTGAPRVGLFSGGQPTPDYRKIERYYQNTVRWLTPRDRRFCWAWLATAVLRVDFEVLELQLPMEPSWKALMVAGPVLERATIRHWGPGALIDIVDDLVLTTNVEPMPFMTMLLSRSESETLIPVHLLRRVVLTAAVNELAASLPDDVKGLESVLSDFPDEKRRVQLRKGVIAGRDAIVMYLRGALQRTQMKLEEMAPP